MGSAGLVACALFGSHAQRPIQLRPVETNNHRAVDIDDWHASLAGFPLQRPQVGFRFGHIHFLVGNPTFGQITLRGSAMRSGWRRVDDHHGLHPPLFLSRQLLNQGLHLLRIRSQGRIVFCQGFRNTASFNDFNDFCQSSLGGGQLNQNVIARRHPAYHALDTPNLPFNPAQPAPQIIRRPKYGTCLLHGIPHFSKSETSGNKDNGGASAMSFAPWPTAVLQARLPRPVLEHWPLLPGRWKCETAPKVPGSCSHPPCPPRPCRDSPVRTHEPGELPGDNTVTSV